MDGYIVQCQTDFWQLPIYLTDTLQDALDCAYCTDEEDLRQTFEHRFSALNVLPRHIWIIQMEHGFPVHCYHVRSFTRS